MRSYPRGTPQATAWHGRFTHSVPPSAVAVRARWQKRDEIVGRRDEPACNAAIALAAATQACQALRAGVRYAPRSPRGTEAPEQERRGTDPLMAGINTRSGALAPRAFRSLIHHDETRS